MSSEDAPESSDATKNSEESVKKAMPNCITCPYRAEHKVPVDGFNAHIWKCRADYMAFFPNALSLKRCRYNIRHMIPDVELKFHEAFCKSQTAEARAQLATEPVFLDVAGFIDAQKMRKMLEKGDDYNSDESDNGNLTDSDESTSSENDESVSSEIEEDVKVEPDDMKVAMNRLKYLELKKKEFI
ncbi:unnamed protein product [Caenorhabditis nigoni]